MRMTFAEWFWWTVHNCVAHPLLVIYPRLGEWLHAYTIQRMEPYQERQRVGFAVAEGISQHEELLVDIAEEERIRHEPRSP